MKKSAETSLMPFEAADASELLGARIRTARKARQWTQAELGERAEISTNTIIKMEAGGLAIQLGFYLKALWALDLINSFSSLLEPLGQSAGEIALMEASMPKRIRKKKQG